METGLFEIQAAHLRDYRQNRPVLPGSRDTIHAEFRWPDAHAASHGTPSIMETAPGSGSKADTRAVEFARCFLRLANATNFAVDRLSRYEATLWRQARQIMLALDALDRHKPQERTRRFCVDDHAELPTYERDDC